MVEGADPDPAAWRNHRPRQEKARLAKEIGRLDAELAKIAAKLANPDFLAKAKAEVVEEQREREADVRRDRDRLRAAYERLKEIDNGAVVLRKPEAEHLVPEELVGAARSEEMRRVAEEFSVAITDDMAALIDPLTRPTRSRRNSCRVPPNLRPRLDDRPDPIGDEHWSPLPGIVHRYPDRVLLKPICCARSIAASAFAASWSAKRPAMLPRRRSTAPSLTSPTPKSGR